MISKLTEKDVDRIRKKVESLYKNFGINTDNMSDEELGRIIKHYAVSPERMRSDLSKSKGNDIDEDDILN